MGNSHSFVLSNEFGKLHDNLLREAKQLYAKCGLSERVTPAKVCVSLVFCRRKIICLICQADAGHGDKPKWAAKRSAGSSWEQPSWKKKAADVCHKCGKAGHWARDCRSRK